MPLRIANLVLFALVVFTLKVPIGAAQGAVQESTPRWLAWRVFHDSLVFYGQRSPQQVNSMLATQFNLTGMQAARLLSTGQSYLAVLQRVDADAKAEAMRRYKPTPPSGPPSASGGRVVNTRPQKRIRERAIDDGLFAQVETQKQAALMTHLQALGLDAQTLEQIDNYVQSSIAPRIKTFAAPPTTGNRGLPPGLTRETKMR